MCNEFDNLYWYDCSMSTSLTLVPAYGRDYKSEATLLADWKAGMDFRIMDASCRYSGAYINQQDALNTPALREVHVRYDRLLKQAIIPLK